MRHSPFSADGYIVDQRHTKDYRYGRFESHWNGCGWIAVYNLLRALGKDPDPAAVNREMDAILPWGGFFGTPVRTVKRYLASRGVTVRTACCRRGVLRAARNRDAGLLRYIEGREPHYVAFVRQGGGNFRFFNAIEGRERHLCTMADFLDNRAKFPFFRAFFV